MKDKIKKIILNKYEFSGKDKAKRSLIDNRISKKFTNYSSSLVFVNNKKYLVSEIYFKKISLLLLFQEVEEGLYKYSGYNLSSESFGKKFNNIRYLPFSEEEVEEDIRINFIKKEEDFLKEDIEKILKEYQGYNLDLSQKIEDLLQ